MMNTEYLVLTAVGTDRPGIVAEITELVAEKGANVADSRMALLGGEFALMMLLAGEADTLSGLRNALGQTAERLGLQVIFKETGSPATHRAGGVRSYRIDVHALDHPGIVHAVTARLRALGGNIVSLETSAYQASVTGTPLFCMELQADFPGEVGAARLREALDEVGETANADVDVRPA